MVGLKQLTEAEPPDAFDGLGMLEIWGVADPPPRVETAPSPAPMPRPRSRWSRLAVAAAVLVAGVPLAAYTGWNLGSVANSYERFEADAKVRHNHLGDGSPVALNLGSELVFANYKNQRRGHLKKGGAFFGVSHDPRHPIAVRAATDQDP